MKPPAESILRVADSWDPLVTKFKLKLRLSNNFGHKTIIPGIEEKIKVEWKYGNNINDDTPDEVESTEEENE